ncbi:MAG: hypothetical protein EOO23_01930 [Comamonadaceae bacterium]|nr:MAG: hypothetical protein EOO23_01930 [Comamonadaceae bacterium]
MQVLTVCRFEANWAFRDVTGETYGHSPDIRVSYESAQQMARRIGAHIEFSAEAERHYRAAIDGRPVPADSVPEPAPKSSRRFQALLRRFLGRRRHEADR